MDRRPTTLLIAGVWLINGLWSKIAGQTPRHEEIVARILAPPLTSDQAGHLTILIGVSEVCLGLWILSGFHPRLTAWFQITLVLLMNVLETTLARDLLLWGPWNLLWASSFAVLVWWHWLRPQPIHS